MLVITRKFGEGLLIGDEIAVTVVRIAGGSVRLGIDAPLDCSVARGELLEEIKRAANANPPPTTTPHSAAEMD